MARSQPSKNAEKADIVKALRSQFPLDMLLPMVGLKRSTFFYHLAEKIDKNSDIVQKVARFIRNIRAMTVIAVLLLYQGEVDKIADNQLQLLRAIKTAKKMPLNLDKSVYLFLCLE